MSEGDASQAGTPQEVELFVWAPWRWSAGTWATVAVLALAGAAGGLIAVLVSGFVFDPNDHGTEFFAAKASAQLKVLVAEIVACVLAALACGAALRRAAAQRLTITRLALGATGISTAVALLLLALQWGVPALGRMQQWAVTPPL